MAKLVLFNKPFDCLSQFTSEGCHRTLAEFIDIPGVYPAGRLDRDSEGLLLLTDDGRLQHQIAHPSVNKLKHYLVQVEGTISDAAIDSLCRGVTLKDGPTKPAQAKRVAAPALWERVPPIHSRHVTSWVRLAISEGRNRQVRRMTAAVGYPTLRLVRDQIDQWKLDGLRPGEFKVIDINMPVPKLSSRNRKKRRY